MKRENLQVLVSDTTDETGFRQIEYRLATDDDLATLGYIRADEFYSLAEEAGWVRRPVCGECEGTGECPNPIHQRLKRMNPMHAPGNSNPHLATGCLNECPSCDGTGFGRLVALDQIEWHVRDRLYSNCDHDHLRAPHGRGCLDPKIAPEVLLVALDGIDVEAARYFVGRPVAAWMMRASGEVVTPVDVLSQVLAAIDGEDTP